jgi:hypothetical protein
MRSVQMIFEKIIEIVTSVETTDLQNLVSLDQISQKQRIDTFQTRIHANLAKILPNMNWRSPHQLTRERRDEVDIYGTFSSEDGEGAVIIELDKWRADQVAKKFVSRFALTLERPLIYTALCYGGTNNMNKMECEKYFGYCNNICNAFTQCNLCNKKQFFGHILLV